VTPVVGRARRREELPAAAGVAVPAVAAVPPDAYLLGHIRYYLYLNRQFDGATVDP
jgi:hypothetical protein